MGMRFDPSLDRGASRHPRARGILLAALAATGLSLASCSAWFSEDGSDGFRTSMVGRDMAGAQRAEPGKSQTAAPERAAKITRPEATASNHRAPNQRAPAASNSRAAATTRQPNLRIASSANPGASTIGVAASQATATAPVVQKDERSVVPANDQPDGTAGSGEPTGASRNEHGMDPATGAEPSSAAASEPADSKAQPAEPTAATGNPDEPITAIADATGSPGGAGSSTTVETAAREPTTITADATSSPSAAGSGEAIETAARLNEVAMGAGPSADSTADTVPPDTMMSVVVEPLDTERSTSENASNGRGLVASQISPEKRDRRAVIMLVAVLLIAALAALAWMPRRTRPPGAVTRRPYLRSR